MRVFWDIDTQVDFVMPHGRLYVTGAENLVDNLRELTQFAHDHGIRVIASADDHVEGHEEISETPDFDATFPPHCLRGSTGQARIAATALNQPLVIEPDRPLPDLDPHRGDFLLHKHYFDVFTNPHVDAVIRHLGVTTAVVYGVALDVCVRFAVEGLRARHPDINLMVVTDAVRALDEARGTALLDNWAQRGVRLASTRDIVAP